MKRETKRWLRDQPRMWQGMGSESDDANSASADALASDAKQKALIRDLRSQLKTQRNAVIEECAKRLEWALPKTNHQDTMRGAAILVRCLKAKR